jgi:hypothetical protein
MHTELIRLPRGEAAALQHDQCQRSHHLAVAKSPESKTYAPFEICRS